MSLSITGEMFLSFRTKKSFFQLSPQYKYAVEFRKLKKLSRLVLLSLCYAL